MLKKLTAFPIPSFHIGIGLTILLVALADLAFLHEGSGWLSGIYLLAATISLWGYRQLSSIPFAWVPTLLVCLSAIRSIENPGPIPGWIAFFGLTAMAVIEKDVWITQSRRWFNRFNRLGLTLAFLFPRDIFNAINDRPIKGAKLSKTSRFVLLSIIPIWIGLLFLLIFTNANPILENYLADVFRCIGDLLKNIEYSRLFYWIFMSFVTWAYLNQKSGFIKINPFSSEIPGISAPNPDAQRDHLFITRFSLLLFNVIFLAQNLLDLTYLWSNVQLPQGITFAQYAHKGAYTLVGTALLSAILVLAMFKTNSPGNHDKTSRLLAYVWLAQNALLVLSSILRLDLYIDSYGLTLFRIASCVWMGLVALGLFWISLRLKTGKSNDWLIGANVLSLLITLSLCLPFNFEGLVANYNTRNCLEMTGRGVSLDLNYLRELGPAAIPSLEWFIVHAKNNQKTQEASQLLLCLKSHLIKETGDWRQWSFLGSRIARKHIQPADVDLIGKLAVDK